MSINVSIRLDYENTLLGHQAAYKLSKKDTDRGEIDSRIHSLLHYIFDELLEWTPKMVRDYLNWNLIEWLNITSVINKIEFPPELDPQKDLFYVAALLYPDEVSYKKKDYVLQVYEKVLNNELNKFPKSFFTNAEGIKNLQTCFRYYVQQKLYDKNIKELYLYFSDRVRAKKFLVSSNLSLHYGKHYDRVIDLFHDCLNEGERSELYYHYAKFLLESSIVKENLGKK